MSAISGLNHVSVVARRLSESVTFYEEFFGLRRIPTPNFGFPVQWLSAGRLQVHLFERPDDPPRYHHFAFTVDTAAFPDLYRRALERELVDRESFGHHLYRLPGDTLQLYLRDPAGNLVEVDAPGASTLPAEIRADSRPLNAEQGEENLKASLFL